jgi:hypothetical protein
LSRFGFSPAGSLGFLTNHAFKDFRRDLHDVIHGGEGLEECSMPGEEIRVRRGRICSRVSLPCCALPQHVLMGCLNHPVTMTHRLMAAR